MFYQILPQFKRHSILRAEVLTDGFEQNKKLSECMYAGYADGIVEGVQVNISENIIGIEPGVVLHDGKLYYQEETQYLPCEPKEEVQYVYLRFWEEQQKENEVLYYGEILLTAIPSERANDMELGRFLLKEGAFLRKDYQSLEDFKTEHNTLHICHVPYAGRGEACFSPEITRYYGKELMKQKEIGGIDAAFAMECLRGDAIPMELVRCYLTKRLERNIEEAAIGEQLLDYFIEALQKGKAEANKPKERLEVPRSPRRTLLT